MQASEVDGLYPRQRAWCVEYVKCNNGAEAARKTGYSIINARKMAEKLLRNKFVKQYVIKLRGEVVEAAKLEALHLVEEALCILKACMDKDENGNPGKKFDSAGALGAIKVLKDYTGGFDKNIQRGEHSGPGGGPIPVRADIAPELRAKVEKTLDAYVEMRKSRK